MSAGALDVLFAAVESSPDAVGFGLDGLLVHVNRAFLDLFGYADPAELIGQPLTVLGAPESVANIERMIADRVAGSRETKVVYNHARRRDGSIFDAETTSTVL